MRKVALFLLATLLFSCQPDRTSSDQEGENEALTIQLVCEDIGSDDTQPYFGVYAIVNESKTKIKEITTMCENITTEEYPALEIPEDAISAVGGWWAGAGDYFYAAQNGETITFYYAGVDEMQDEPITYQAIARFEDGRFSVSLTQ
jgi:hypothetical protein